MTKELLAANQPQPPLSIRADAARVLVGGYTVHLELASSRSDGTFAPELQVAIPLAMAAELANLLLDAVRRAG